MTRTWKPSRTQAKHIEVNRLLTEAGWLMPNSRKGLALHLFEGAETGTCNSVTWRFSDAERDAMYRVGRAAYTPEEAHARLHT